MRCFGVNIRVLMLTVSVIVFESLTVSGFVHSNSVGHSTAACNLLSTSSNNAILPRKCNSNYACNSYRHSYGYSCSNSYSYRYSRAVCRESLSLNVHKNNDEMDVVNKAINNSSSNLLRDYLIAFLAIPLASQLLPSLLSKVTDFSVAATDRQYYIIGLLLAKRVYLYSLAAVTVAITAKRSVGLSTQLGKRLGQINDELFGKLPKILDSEEDSDAIGSISTSTNSNSINSRSRSVEEQEMYNLIDDVPEATQALLLPLFVALSLISSFAFLGFQSAVSTDTTTTIAGIDMKTLIATLLPFISVASNGIVCYLFTKTEVQNFLSMIWKKDISVPTDYYSDNNSSAGVVAGLASALLLGSALLSPVGGSLWPVHNIINLCISVTVARAFQLTKLPLVVAALFGLTVYDVVSVLGTQQFTDGGKSIMEAVAMAKIGSVANSAAGTASNTLTEMHSWTDQLQRLFSQVFSGSAWKPGLFNVAIGGRVSDVLGLGDVVFPALLSTWALRFDKDNDRDSNVSTLASEDSKSNLYSVTIFGYLLGCFLCEVFQTGEGQPALLYIVPAMLASLLVKGIQTGSLGKMISYEPSE